MARFTSPDGVGAPGPVGPTGLAGATGPEGPIGIQGIQGEPGNDLSAVVGNIIPSLDDTYNLGSSSYRWNSLFLGPDSLSMIDDLGDAVTLSTIEGSLVIDGADIIRIGNMNFTATGIESAISAQDITIGNLGDTGYLSTARGIKFPDATVQTTAAVAQVNSDWDAATGLAEILNKPELLQGPEGPIGLTGATGPQGDPGVGIGLETSFVVVGGTTGTQPTFNGAPLFSGSYVLQGPLVHFQIQVSFSNITNFGTGQYYINLPFPSKYGYQVTAGCVHDISEGKDYLVSGHVFAGSSQLLLKSVDATGNSVFDVPFTKTSPFTLATADSFHISGDYIYSDA